jgi:predicted metal-binding protein
MTSYSAPPANFRCTKCSNGYCTKRGMTRASHEAFFMATQQGWTCRVCGSGPRSKSDPYHHTCGECRGRSEEARIQITLIINDVAGLTTRSQRRARNRREIGEASVITYAYSIGQEPTELPTENERMKRGKMFPVKERPSCGICDNTTASRVSEDKRTFACARCSEEWFKLGGPKTWCVLVHTEETEK